MRSIKNKQVMLAGAVMAALPLVGKAAIITYSYESGMQYTTDGGTTFTPVTPTIVGGNYTVTIPVGASLVFGVQGSVTGAPNSAPTGAGTYQAAHAALVPANLGLAIFGFGLTDSAGSHAAMDTGAWGNNSNGTAINADFSNKFTGTDDGSGGYTLGSVSGSNLGTTNVNTTAAYAAGSAADLVSNVWIDGLTAGTSVFTPSGAYNGQAYYAYSAGGTSASNKPTYTTQAVSQASDTLNLPGTLTVIVGSGATSSSAAGGATGSNKVLSLTSSSPTQGTAPNGYGSSSLGTLDVHNGTPAFLNLPGGQTSGYVATSGGPNGVAEIALQIAIGGSVLAPTDTRLPAIIADMKNSSTGVTTGGITTVSGSTFANLFPGYDILVPGGSGSPFFAFDVGDVTADDTLGGGTDTSLGAVTVTAIAAVPEPATVAGVVLGAAGLLLGRRKNRAAA